MAYCEVVVKICRIIQIKMSQFKKMSILSPSYEESDVAVTSISQSLPHIMAVKQLA